MHNNIPIKNNIYVSLVITGACIFGIEIISLIHEPSSLLLADLGHAGSHLGIALWGLLLSRDVVSLSPARQHLFRTLSSMVIAIATITGVVVSLSASHEHHHAGWMFLIIGILGIVQHRLLHTHHDHTDGHDILCSGLRWHVLADAVKSFVFASMFFISLFANIEPYENIFIWIARIALMTGAVTMLWTVIKDFQKK